MAAVVQVSDVAPVSLVSSTNDVKKINMFDIKPGLGMTFFVLKNDVSYFLQYKM